MRSDEKSKGERSARIKWVTTAANRHLLKCPRKDKTTAAACARLELAEDERNQHRPDAMHAAGCNKAGASFVLDPRDKALCSQSRMYIYSRQRISKDSHDDPYWREAFQSAYEAGGGKGDCPFIKRKGLISWLKAEFDTFLLYVNYIMTMLVEQHEGNPPCQGVHDCGTLQNKIKCMAMGLEFVTPRLSYLASELPPLVEDAAAAAALVARAPAAKFTAPPPKPPTRPKLVEPPRVNMTICLSMLPIVDGTDATGAAQLKRECKKSTGFEYEDLAYSTISDVAAIGVAALAHGEDGQGCKYVYVIPPPCTPNRPIAVGVVRNLLVASRAIDRLLTSRRDRSITDGAESQSIDN